MPLNKTKAASRTMQQRRLATVTVWVLYLWPQPVWANVVWPALYVQTRLSSGWAIGLGLVIECAFVRWLFGLTVQRTALAVFCANLVSALLGMVLLPLAGIVWELFPASVYNWLLGWGTFNPLTWGRPLYWGV